MGEQQTIEQHGKVIHIRNVQARAHRKFGKLHEGCVSEGEHIDLVIGESIRLFGPALGHDLTFRIGDSAEYHSYNYHYVGKIVAIAPKTVTIKHDAGSRSTRTRLSLWEFSWRNKDFDALKISEANFATTQHI